jgi:PKD repeat protein
VCLTVWRDSACFNTYCQYIQVYDNAACKAYFTAYADTGSGVAFKNGSSGNPTKFFWDFGDGTTSVYENPYHVYQQKGNYKVCLTVSSGSCTDTWCDYIRVGCDSTDCPGMFSYYEDSTKAGQFYFYSNSNYPVVKWDFGDGNVAYQGPGASNYYQSSGTYRVCMTVLEDSIEVTYCDTIVVNRPVGIQKPAAAEIAGIYPNPASGIAYLSLKLVQKSNVRVVVQTLLGSTSEAFAACALDAGEHRIALDTGSLPGGIYLVKVITDSNEKVIRLVVTD